VTAENDSATGTWFPFGMLWAAWGETANRGGERRSLLNTMGHIDSLITHELSVPGIRTRAKYQPAAEPKTRTGDDAVPAIIGRALTFDGGCRIGPILSEPAALLLLGANLSFVASPIMVALCPTPDLRFSC
jgi:hypothetical protein